MAELVVSSVSTMILLSGLSSAIFIANTAASPDTNLARSMTAGTVLDEIVSDLRMAKAFTGRTSQSVTFVVDDRSTDSGTVDETIAYSWNGSAGGTLKRVYNGVSTSVLTDVYQFSLEYSTASVALNKRLLFIHGNAVGTPAVHDNNRVQLLEGFGYSVIRKLVTSSTTQLELEVASATMDVIYVSPTVNAPELGSKLISSGKGIVLEKLSCAPYFSLADAGPLETSNNRIKIDDNTHYITSPFLNGPLVIYSSTVNIACLDADFAPGFTSYCRRQSGGSEDMLGVVNTGGRLLNNTRAAGPRILVPWGGTGADPLLLNSNGRMLMQRSVDWAAGTEALVGVQVTLRVGSASGPVLTARTEVVGRPRP